MLKQFFVFSIIVLNLILIKNQDPCSNIVSPSTYDQCATKNNITASTLCCFIRGLYGGSNGTACIPVDTLFANKSLTYTLNGLTGTMICGNTISPGTYLSTNSFFTKLLLIILTFFLL